MYLSIGSVLELLVLKNAAECTSQRLKRTSGARVMIISRCSIHKWSFSLYLSIGSVIELFVLKNAAECTSQRLKWTSGARVMIMQIYMQTYAKHMPIYTNMCKYMQICANICNYM